MAAFRQSRRAAVIEQTQAVVAQTAMEVYADRPANDLAFAIGVGLRTVERGTSFMDAMNFIGDVLDALEQQARECEDALTRGRNQERLRVYRAKRAVFNGGRV